MTTILPTSVEIGGVAYSIRSDYRDILTILTAVADPELTPQERSLVALYAFYLSPEEIPQDGLQEALDRLSWFVQGGNETPGKNPCKLMDWEQDFQWIVAPVNRVLGRDIRESTPLHWWTFLAAYYEIGDCFFAQVVRIRRKRARGERMDKTDRDFERENADIINLRTKYTEEEDEFLKLLGGGGSHGG